MKEFLTMLFFGSSLLLTPAPIDIGKEWVNLIPKKPIEAVNGGARLCLDITKAIGKIDDTGVLDKMLPAGTIEAELITEKGASFTLRNSGSYSFQYASGVVSFDRISYQEAFWNSSITD